MHIWRFQRLKHSAILNISCYQISGDQGIEMPDTKIGTEEKNNSGKRDWSNVVVYTHLARALARGYTDLFYVNTETEEYIEFHTDDESGVLSEARRGKDFFAECAIEAKPYVHKDDQVAFVHAMNHDFLEEALRDNKVFELIYRRIKGGDPFYVQMKVTRMEDDPRFIVIAVSDIDELMKKRQAQEKIQEERIIYARLHALTGNFISAYVVDPETDYFREFNATNDFSNNITQTKEGPDFFDRVRGKAGTFCHPEDTGRFLSAFTKENILEEIEQNGIFTVVYRIMEDGKPVHVQAKAAMVEEKEGPRLVVGVNDIESQVHQEEEFLRRLAEAQNQANVDALTGIKNKHAYLETEVRMDRLIAAQRQGPFAVVIFDVNDLKKVNDMSGHQAGDRYLCGAAEIICDIFKHSPVFRVGGDEFAVISQAKDYSNIDELIDQVSEHNINALKNGGIVIACGMSKYDYDDDCVANVFERADHEMYRNKTQLKTGRSD